MSKEYLEAFKNLKQELYYSPNQIPDIDKWHEIIENALQRLEAIDNANPSEALECLENIINDKKMHDYILYNCLDEDFINIRKSLLKAQEQEKVLEIIKEKSDLSALEMADNVNEFNEMASYKKPYTEEEFDLLKRWANE